MDHGMLLHRRDPSTPDSETPANASLALCVICLCALTIALDLTITNVALPFIGRDLEADTSDLQWVIDAYNIVLAGLLVLAGGLGDRFGRKTVFLAGYSIFGVGCAAAAFSPTVEVLILARVLMGVGAAGAIAPALAIISTLYPPEKRAAAVSMWAVFGSVGLALGPVAGGVLLDSFWWGSVFIVAVPVSAVAVFMGAKVVPQSRKPDAQRLDLVGAALSVVGLGVLLGGVIEAPALGWLDPLSLVVIGAGILLVVAFVAWELHTSTPMFDVRILRRPAVAAGTLSLFTTYLCYTGLLFLVPQYLQEVQGRSVIVTGLSMVPFAIAFVIVSQRAPRMMQREGSRVLTLGLLGMAVGLAFLALLPEVGEWSVVIFATIVVGAAIGLLIAPGSTVVMNDLPIEKAGDGSSLNMVGRFAGGAIGVALLGSVFASVFASDIHDTAARLAPQQAEVAEQSISGARRVASSLSAAPAHELVTAAEDAFDDAAQIAFVAATLIALAAAGAVRAALRSHGAGEAKEDATA